MKRNSVKLLAVLLTVGLGCHGQTPPLQTLKAKSTWGGLGKPAKSEFSVNRREQSYFSGRRPVANELIKALLTAVAEPALNIPTAANLGLTPQWLHAHAEEAGQSASRLYYRTGLPEQKAMFRGAFEDERSVPSRLKEVYQSSHTDDYPHMRVQLKLQDGTSLTLTTDSQNPFMLPWCITSKSVTTKTYNANISRALLALLPATFVNRDRLSGQGFVSMLGEETASTVERRWKLVGAERAAGDALRILRSAYTVRSATVDSYHDFAFGKAWDSGEPHEENLHATLWRPGFPQGFDVNAILLRERGDTKGATDLLRQSPKYENLVLSVPWLRSYLEGHPQEHSWLFYVHDESLSDKAMKIFAADMAAAGRADVVARVQAVQQQVALLETGHGDYWIILPDRTVILWRWESLDHILKWKISQFPAHECTDYRTVTGGCAGAVVSSDGALQLPEASLPPPQDSAKGR